jgi:mono/diheme cytochrome c family protein
MMIDSRCRHRTAVPVIPLGCAVVMGLSLAWAPLAGRANDEAASSVASEPADFATHIQPILEAHCHRCHGMDEQSNGLRLDERASALLGGYSQRPVAGGDLTTNELYLRVSSDDPTYRMPKNAPPLEERQIAMIRDWVAAGGVWPEAAPPTAVPPSRGSRNWWERAQHRWPWIEGLLDEVLRYTEVLRPYFYALLALHVLVLLIERGKLWQRQEHRWTRGRGRRLFAACAAFRASHYLLVLLALVFAVYVQVTWQKTQALARRQVELQAQVAELQGHVSAASSPAAVAARAYGDPPIPLKPSHPARLGGEYYRGNCERNAKLFNGGNYRTATFRLSLCDSRRQPLEVGDAVAPSTGDDALLVRLEIERSPGTTDALYGDATMRAVFLSRELYGSQFEPLRDDPPRLTTLRPQWQWEVYFPIGPLSDDAAGMSGVIYVYSGALDDENRQARGDRHYGIVYDLTFQQGRLAEGSELWMGSLLWNSQLAVPQPGKVPLEEWFDARPIPEITGPNSDDPVLLGIPEHLAPSAGQDRPAR